MQLRHGSLLHFLSEDFMDAYRAMRSSIGLHESDENYMKDIMSRESAGNERPSDPRNIPVLDASDYGGNWQIKVLERANRLKQQRLERQKTATERRQTLENKQRERWKNSNHFECAQGIVLNVISIRLLFSSEIISKRHSTTLAMGCGFQHSHKKSRALYTYSLHPLM